MGKTAKPSKPRKVKAPAKPVLQLALGHHLIDVYRDPPEDIPDSINPVDVYGYYVPHSDGNGDIYVRSELEGDHAGETYIHECIECANDCLDLNLNHTQIQSLGFALQRLLKVTCPR